MQKHVLIIITHCSDVPVGFGILRLRTAFFRHYRNRPSHQSMVLFAHFLHKCNSFICLAKFDIGRACHDSASLSPVYLLFSSHRFQLINRHLRPLPILLPEPQNLSHQPTRLRHRTFSLHRVPHWRLSFSLVITVARSRSLLGVVSY